MQTATFRRQAAFLGSWELCLQHVAEALGLASAEGFRAAAPVTVAAVEAAAADYRSLHTSTAGYKFEWELLIGQAQTRRQAQTNAANPHAGLVPFVIESLGRPGTCAMHLLRAMAPKDATSRSSELRRAWCELSTLIQIRQADLLINAEYAQPGEARAGESPE